jgi:hypothetical protein
MIVMVLVGCSTLSTIDGARTLDRGQSQWKVAISDQYGSNGLSSASALPEVEVAYRRGFAEDFDAGVRFYLLGTMLDARYRVFHEGRWHLAVDPGVGLFFLPTIGGSVDVRAPLIAEYEVNRWFSLAGGPKAILRTPWNRVDLGDGKHAVQGRFDVYAGGALRLDVQSRRVSFGLTTDVYGQPARASGFAWSIGLDVGFLRRSKAERAASVR